MTVTDERIREALRPLREHEPEAADVERVLHHRRPAPRRGGLRLAIAGVAVAATAVALLTAGDERTPLEVAAARAAEQSGASFEGFRYTRVRDRFDEPRIDASRCPAPEPARPGSVPGAPQDCITVDGRATRESVREQWVDVNWNGRLRTSGWTSGTIRLADPLDQPFEYGDGPLAGVDLRSLPLDAAARERRLRDAIESPAAQEDYELVRSAILLITEARVGPRLRSAAWTLLSRIPGARAGGDSLTIETTYTGQRQALTLRYDPEIASIRSWSQRSIPPDERLASTESHTVEMVGDVAAVGDRP